MGFGSKVTTCHLPLQALEGTKKQRVGVATCYRGESHLNNEADSPPRVSEAEASEWDQAALPGDVSEHYRVPERIRRRRHRTPPGAEKEWYSKSEAARYLGVAEISVTRYLARGLLQAHRLPVPATNSKQGRYNYGRLRIHKTELDRYLEVVDRRPADGAAPVHTESATGSDTSVPTRASDEILTREQAALQLGVSWRTIKRYIESGKLRLAGYFRCSDSYTRAHVYHSDVEKLLRGEPQT